MEIIRQDSNTTQVRLGEAEYLIVHTLKGTIDINVRAAIIDINERASGIYKITRYDPSTLKQQPAIKPLERQSLPKKR
jgi:hypothetical protein